MAIELPFGAKLEAPDVIYSKDLATIFHDGNTILVEADSFQLPFIDIMPDRSARINALQKNPPHDRGGGL